MESLPPELQLRVAENLKLCDLASAALVSNGFGAWPQRLLGQYFKELPYSSVQEAFKFDDWDAVEQWLRRGANHRICSPFYPESTLLDAALEYHATAVVKLIVEREASMPKDEMSIVKWRSATSIPDYTYRVVNWDPEIALQHRINNGDSAAIDILLRSGVQIDNTDRFGVTPSKFLVPRSAGGAIESGHQDGSVSHLIADRPFYLQISGYLFERLLDEKTMIDEFTREEQGPSTRSGKKYYRILLPWWVRVERDNYILFHRKGNPY